MPIEPLPTEPTLESEATIPVNQPPPPAPTIVEPTTQPTIPPPITNLRDILEPTNQ
jgi:hypothetical protein